MKTSIKTLAVVVAAVLFTACSKPTIDPVRPVQPATSIIMPVTPNQPQPIDERADDEQPTGRPAKIASEMPTLSDQQPATVGNPAPQPTPRPDYQKPSKKPAQLTEATEAFQ